MPRDACVQVHQRIERAGFVDRRKQGWRVDAECARVDGERGTVRGERAEDDVVGVEILSNTQHGGAAEFCGSREAVAFQFACAASVGIDLCARIGKILDGELFQALA